MDVPETPAGRKGRREQTRSRQPGKAKGGTRNLEQGTREKKRRGRWKAKGGTWYWETRRKKGSPLFCVGDSQPGGSVGLAFIA
jgi:hypothetical protein